MGNVSDWIIKEINWQRQEWAILIKENDTQIDFLLEYLLIYKNDHSTKEMIKTWITKWQSETDKALIKIQELDGILKTYISERY